MGGSDQWFAHFERIDNEREAGELDITDEEAADLADARLIDDIADRADQIADERWLEERGGDDG